MCECKVCGVIVKDHKNSLSLHIRVHGISTNEYYTKYIDSRTTCIDCGCLVNFRNINLGYVERCIVCRTKKQWEGTAGEERKSKNRELFLTNNPAKKENFIGRKGKKNKAPYPTDSPANILKFATTKHKIDYTKLNNRIDKVSKQKETWEQKSDEEIRKIIELRDDRKMAKKESTFHQGVFVPKNPLKYEGDVSKIYYRSSWELKFLLWCDNNPNVILYSSEEVIIPYIKPTDNKIHRYFVDAKVTVKDKSGKISTYLIEIKPDVQTRPPEPKKRKTKHYIDSILTWTINEAKWNAAKKYADKKGYTFKILTEHDLNV